MVGPLSKMFTTCVVPNVWHLYTPPFLLNLFGRIEISLHSQKELVQIALLRHS